MRYSNQIDSTTNTGSLPGDTPAVDGWMKLERFLLLGSEAGVYHANPRPFAVAGCPAVLECLRQSGEDAVERILSICESGRAPNRSPALFSLAVAASPAYAPEDVNRAALCALPRVASTGLHLLEFAAYARQLRGWGRALRSAIADWYLQKPVKELAHDLVKPARGGWSHRDLLRMAHPKPETPEQRALFQWVVDGELGHLAPADAPFGPLRPLYAADRLRKAEDVHEVAHLVEEYGVPTRCVPAKWKKAPEVWEALLHGMSYTALLRNLGRMTEVGVLAEMSPATALAVTRLTDARRIVQARVSPITVLGALRSYQRRPNAVSGITRAVEEAFYVAVDNVSPSNLRLYVAIDARSDDAAALALIFARREPDVIVTLFSDTVEHVSISKADRLEEVRSALRVAETGSDAYLPFEDACRRGVEADAFVIITDADLWPEDRSPAGGLRMYRWETGRDAKLAIIALTAAEGGRIDADHPNHLEVAGFNSTALDVFHRFLTGQPLTASHAA